MCDPHTSSSNIPTTPYPIPSAGSPPLPSSNSRLFAPLTPSLYGRNARQALRGLATVSLTRAGARRALLASGRWEDREEEEEEMVEEIKDIESAQECVCDCLRKSDLAEILLENTKMLVLDTRLPLYIAMRCLFEYKKALALTYSEEECAFVGYLDAIELMDFVLHLHAYLRGWGDDEGGGDGRNKKKEKKKCEADQPSNEENNESRLKTGRKQQCKQDETAPVGPVSTSKGTSILNSNSTKGSSTTASTDRQTTTIPPTTPCTTPTRCDTTTNSVASIDSNGATISEGPTMDSSMPAAFTGHSISSPSSCTLPSSSVHLSSCSRLSSTTGCSSSGRTVSLFHFPFALAPWTYTIEHWRRVNGSCCSPLLKVPLQNTTPLDALRLLLDYGCSYVAVWSEQRASPLGFVTLTCLLGLIVQQLKGRYSIFRENIKSSLKIGTFTNIATVHVDSTFCEAVRVIRDRNISAVPLVDANGCYIGCFTKNHFMHVIARAIQNSLPIDSSAGIASLWRSVLPPSSSCSSSAPGGVRNAEGGDVHGSGSSSTSGINSGVGGCKEGETATRKRQGSDSSLNTSGFGGAGVASSHTAPFVNYAMTTAPDMCLRDAIVHALFSEEKRLIFVDKDTRTVVGVVTLSDLLKFLISHQKEPSEEEDDREEDDREEDDREEDELLEEEKRLEDRTSDDLQQQGSGDYYVEYNYSTNSTQLANSAAAFGEEGSSSVRTASPRSFFPAYLHSGALYRMANFGNNPPLNFLADTTMPPSVASPWAVATGSAALVAQSKDKLPVQTTHLQSERGQEIEESVASRREGGLQRERGVSWAAAPKSSSEATSSERPDELLRMSLSNREGAETREAQKQEAREEDKGRTKKNGWSGEQESEGDMSPQQETDRAATAGRQEDGGRRDIFGMWEEGNVFAASDNRFARLTTAMPPYNPVDTADADFIKELEDLTIR